MTTEQINKLCTESAETYLNFLFENKKKRGVEKIYIKKIEPDGINKTLLLYLGKKINENFLNNIFFLLEDEKIIPCNDIVIKSYSKETLCLKVKILKQELFQKFISTDIDKIKIASDLKFLVARVRDWYKNNNLPFCIPDTTNSVPFDANLLKNELYPKKTQIQAINQILFGYEDKTQIDGSGEKALTYIWGAPGTGKTQVVMAYSALHYVKYSNSDKKVLLIAPTNTALEQMIYGFINALTPADETMLQKILRLGVASWTFQEKYSFMCNTNNENNIKIIACTLDYYIAQNLQKIYKFEHIFLDEAGYTPLIKALTLFTNNCPITLLGDHMQLKPVCEMDEEKIKSSYHNVFLWGQSAMYIADILLFSEEENINNFIKNNPIFKKIFDVNHPMKTIALKETYRFGSDIAEVLDKNVYNIGFSASTLNNQTKIFYIDAVYNNERENSSDRSNHAEAAIIKKFIKKITYVNKNKDIAVLTPYRKQQQTIGKYVPILLKNEALFTIHASQGKEWDTVILSVADNDKGNNTRYFTDTQKKECSGLNLINTAVSRAKNNLIIVCDYDHWVNLQNQLISDLLKISKKIDVDNIETYPVISEKIIQLKSKIQTSEQSRTKTNFHSNNITIQQKNETQNINQPLSATHKNYPYNVNKKNKKNKVWIYCFIVIAMILFFIFINYKNTVYITQHGKKFHKKSCETIEYSYTDSISIKKALESGRTRCKVCKP